MVESAHPRRFGDLGGKVVLVTGGNAGLGLGFARGIARAGGGVVVWGRRAEKNAEALAELAALGAPASADAIDVADEAAVSAGVARIVAGRGRLDAVIANAGVMNRARSFLDLSSEAYHALLAVNQHGVFYVARAAARHMRDRWRAGDPGGSILFCASLSAHTGTVGMQHYNAAKGAIVAMARGIAVEGGRYGVRCNVVCPGYTATETVKDEGEESPLGQQVRRRTPIPRYGAPEDFEGIGVYFAGDASRFHTGDVVTLDGGWMANAGKSDLEESVSWE